jgi:hypothetical protein
MWLGKRFVYGLKVFLGYQRILDPKGAQTFKRRMSQKKKRTLWKWRKEVCIVRDMMAISQRNELNSKDYMITHSKEKVHMSNII